VIDARSNTVGRLGRCIACLPATHRRVWRMHDFCGLRTREVAQHLGVSRGAIRSRLRTARSALRALLRREFGKRVRLAR
jgi:RNA polymerase sigma factor (sigma-70 family)